MAQLRKIFHPVRFVLSLYRRQQKARPQYAEIGRYHIRLPATCLPPRYKNAFHLYDTALGQVAKVLKAKYPSLKAIDIGANVGDTAALIRESAEIPILCIEGDPKLFPILTENVTCLGQDVAIEYSFVGPDGTRVNLSSADDVGRNARLVEAIEAQGSVKMRSLQTILADHPEFESAKLLKTDTEGFDFEIIRQSLEFIQVAKPVIFFEYGPHFRPDEPNAGLETIQALIDVGYSDFIYYDNFGNFLLHTDSKHRSIHIDLDSYLASNRRHGVAVHYFDICALHREDSDLVPEIRSLTQR
jgi:FkbM family methyltransferase